MPDHIWTEFQIISKKHCWKMRKLKVYINLVDSCLSQACIDFSIVWYPLLSMNTGWDRTTLYKLGSPALHWWWQWCMFIHWWWWCMLFWCMEQNKPICILATIFCSQSLSCKKILYWRRLKMDKAISLTAATQIINQILEF